MFIHQGICASAQRVGCGAMNQIVLLLMVLTPIAQLRNFTVPRSRKLELTIIPSTLPPVVFKNLQRQLTTKPRRMTMKQEKSDSPMLNYIFDSYATRNVHLHDKFKLPSFEGGTSDDINLEADTGATVVFDCRISSLRDKMVSWLRVSNDENLELLTLALETHTTDLRYRVDLAEENWQLALYNAKASDSGVYGCHVSTHPPMLKRFKLTVHEPEIKITKEAFLETSETLSLKCMILHLHPGNPEPILRWYKGNSNVPLDEIRGGVLIETNLIKLTSQLQVAHLNVEDAGNYTCSLQTPLNLSAVSKVHVLRGSNLAELQSGVKLTTNYLSLLLAATIIVFDIYNDD